MEKTRMTIRLVESLNNELERISKGTGRSKNDLIVAACWEFLEEMNYYKGGVENGNRKSDGE